MEQIENESIAKDFTNKPLCRIHGNLSKENQKSEKDITFSSDIFSASTDDISNLSTNEKISLDNNSIHKGHHHKKQNINKAEYHKLILDKYCSHSIHPLYKLNSQVDEIRKIWDHIVISKKKKRKKKDEFFFPEDFAVSNVKNANNFLKTILFGRYIKKNSIVIDLGCGHGPDIAKMKYPRPMVVIYTDISLNSLIQTEKRWTKNKYPYPACFIQDDFTSHKFMKQKILNTYKNNDERKKGEPRTIMLDSRIETKDAMSLVDVISCQFAPQYAFRSPKSAKQFVKNIHNLLKPGGVFIGTAPKGEKIYNILRKKAKDSKYDSGKFAVSVDEETKLKFENTNEPQSFIPYQFSLKNTFEVKEWTMLTSDLKLYFKNVGMKLIYMEQMDKAFEKESINPRNQTVLERMNASGILNAKDEELLSIYVIFAFIKLPLIALKK